MMYIYLDESSPSLIAQSTRALLQVWPHAKKTIGFIPVFGSEEDAKEFMLLCGHLERVEVLEEFP
jgi:hypothetical protein